jgi:hypothetical protein
MGVEELTGGTAFNESVVGGDAGAEVYPDFEFFPAEDRAAGESADAEATFDLEGALNEPEAPSTPDWLSKYQAEADVDSAFSAVVEDSVVENTVIENTTTENEPVPNEPQGVPGPRKGLTALLNNTNLDWLKEPAETTEEPQDVGPSLEDLGVVGEPDDEWMAAFGVQQTNQQVSVDEIPAWLQSLDDAPQDDGIQGETVQEQMGDGAYSSAETNSANTSAADQDAVDMTADYTSEVEFKETVFEADTVDEAELDETLLEEAIIGESPANEMEFDMPTDEDFDWLTSESGEEDDERASTINSDTTESNRAAIQPPPPPDLPTPLSEEEGLPDWLGSFNAEGVGEESGEAEAVANDEYASLFGEVADEAFTGLSSDDEAIAAEIPDWLSEMQPAELSSEDEPPNSAPAPTGESIGATADAAYDWLSGVDTGEDTLEEIGTKIADDIRDAASDLTSAVESGEDAIAAEIPGWLSEMQPPEMPEVTLDDQVIGDDVESLFGTESSEEDVASLFAMDDGDEESEALDDLFKLNQPESEGASESFALSMAVDEEIPETRDEPLPEISIDAVPTTETSEFEWMGEEELAASAMDSEGDLAMALGTVEPSEYDLESTELEEAETVMPIEPMMDGDMANESESQPEWVSETEQAADDMVAEGNMTGTPEAIEEEVAEIEAAVNAENVPNAPDWLNAMVPGIDIDFEATEDEPIESEFVEEPVMIAPEMAGEAPRRDGDFGWLVDIVDEETREEVAPTAGKSRFSFSRRPSWLNFSRPPAWMSGGSAASTASSAVTDDTSPALPEDTDTMLDDDFPDWPADDEEETDPPDWLR